MSEPEETLLHHNGCHHRGMDIAVVAIGSCPHEGKAKGAPRREIPRIERTAVRGNGVGGRIIIPPGHPRTRLHRNSRRTEGKVRDRDTAPSANGDLGRSRFGSRRGSDCRNRRGSDCRSRCGSNCRSRRGSGCGSAGGRCGGRATTGSQEHNKAQNHQAQPGSCAGK